MRKVCSSAWAGFTLIELLVVIAVILILARILAPALDSAKDKANDIICANNLHQLGIAFATYVTDYQNYPSSAWGSYQGPSEYVHRPGGRTLDPLECSSFSDPNPTHWSALGNYVNRNNKVCRDTIWWCPNDYHTTSPDVSYAMNLYLAWPGVTTTAKDVKYPSGAYLLVEQTPNGTDMGQCGSSDRPPGAPGPYHSRHTMDISLFCDGHVKLAPAGWISGTSWNTTTPGTLAYDFANNYGCGQGGVWRLPTAPY